MRGYDGQPRMYQMTGPTGAQAEAALLAKLNEMLPPTDDVISPDMAISELATIWRLEFEDLGWAANTRRRYREIIDTYILPGVGNLTIREANVPPWTSSSTACAPNTATQQPKCPRHCSPA